MKKKIKDKEYTYVKTSCQFYSWKTFENPKTITYFYKCNKNGVCYPIGAINDSIKFLKPTTKHLLKLKLAIGYTFKEISKQEAFIEML